MTMIDIIERYVILALNNQPVSLSNPLPVTGTSTISGPVNANIFDSAGNPLTSTSGALNVNTTGSSTVSGNVGINGLNAFATSQAVIGTSPSQISIPGGTSSVSVKAITTSSLDAVVIGNSGSVSNLINGSGNGYYIFNGDSIQVDITPSASLWAVGTSAGQVICVLFAGG